MKYLAFSFLIIDLWLLNHLAEVIVFVDGSVIILTSKRDGQCCL